MHVAGLVVMSARFKKFTCANPVFKPTLLINCLKLHSGVGALAVVRLKLFNCAPLAECVRNSVVLS